MTRKQFLFGGGGVVAGGVVAGWFGAGLVEYMGAGPETPWKALTEDELFLVSAAGFPSPKIDPDRVKPLIPEKKTRDN